MLTLVLVRHGDAEPKVDGVDDKDRKLVKKGVKQMRRVAYFLEEMELAFDRVMTSTLLRGYQSAEVILEELGEEDKKIETLSELDPDKEPSEFVGKLKEMDNSTLLIVGHEPFLSKLVKEITGGEVEFKKGAVAIVEYDVTKGSGALQLLLNQKVLKLM